MDRIEKQIELMAKQRNVPIDLFKAILFNKTLTAEQIDYICKHYRFETDDDNEDNWPKTDNTTIDDNEKDNKENNEDFVDSASELNVCQLCGKRLSNAWKVRAHKEFGCGRKGSGQ